MQFFHVLRNSIHYFLFFITSSTCSHIYANDFAHQWAQMRILFNELMQNNQAQLLDGLVHPHWDPMRKEMHSLLLGEPNPRFLHHHIIVGNMLRTGYNQTQKYETDFLLHCLSPSIKEKLSRFQETSIGGTGRECKEFDCSSNTLGQLYYFMKLLELRKPASLTKVVEVGGGYGCLARVAKLTIPEVTYVIIDLPEFCAIQYLFLSLTLPNTVVRVHLEKPTQLEQGMIHLIPVYFLPELEITEVDAFISAFGLSETPKNMQQIIMDKNFFNASLCYIIGQANTQQDWLSPQSMINHIRTKYPRNYCYQSHIAVTTAFLYEIFGLKD